eukprot:m.16114 g.16114  ORF g.16114 m.16114 type:complete len:51 (-) comp5010_c0_seq1:969-1121(-)
MQSTPSHRKSGCTSTVSSTTATSHTSDHVMIDPNMVLEKNPKHQKTARSI